MEIRHLIDAQIYTTGKMVKNEVEKRNLGEYKFTQNASLNLYQLS